MDISYCNELVVLADCLSFSQAADRLFITQSTLSKHVATAEKEAGFRIFDRDTTKVELTESGRAYIERLREVAKKYEQAVSEGLELQRSAEATIRVVGPLMNDAIAALVTHAHTQVSATYGGLKTSLTEVGVRDSCERVVSHEADLGIVFRYGKESRSLRFEHLFSIPFGIACYRTHPLAKKERLGFSDLEGARIVSYPLEDRARYHAFVQEVLKRHGIDTRIEHLETGTLCFPEADDRVVFGVHFPGYARYGTDLVTRPLDDTQRRLRRVRGAPEERRPTRACSPSSMRSWSRTGGGEQRRAGGRKACRARLAGAKPHATPRGRQPGGDGGGLFLFLLERLKPLDQFFRRELDVHLAVDVVDMGLDGMARHHQGILHERRRIALRQHDEHLFLPRRQMVALGELGAFLPPAACLCDSGRGILVLRPLIDVYLAALMLGERCVVVTEKERLQKDEDDDDQAQDQRIARPAFERGAERQASHKVSACRCRCSRPPGVRRRYWRRGSAHTPACIRSLTADQQTDSLVAATSIMSTQQAILTSMRRSQGSIEKADGGGWGQNLDDASDLEKLVVRRIEYLERGGGGEHGRRRDAGEQAVLRDRQREYDEPDEHAVGHHGA